MNYRTINYALAIFLILVLGIALPSVVCRRLGLPDVWFYVIALVWSSVNTYLVMRISRRYRRPPT
jgi:hypothetical protein